MKRNRTLALLLALTLLLGGIPISRAKAATISDYYKSWSQGDPAWSGIIMGTEATVGGVGCTTVAIAKLIVQSGALDQNSFNPGTLARYINQKNGYTNLQTDGPYADWGCIRDWGIPAGIAPNFDYLTPLYYNGKSRAEKDAIIKNYVQQGY